MKKTLGIVLGCILFIQAYSYCTVTTSCGGGSTITCTGTCECNQLVGGVSCDGAQSCCPQK